MRYDMQRIIAVFPLENHENQMTIKLSIEFDLGIELHETKQKLAEQTVTELNITEKPT